MIGIVDYGMGNLRSICNAFGYLGEEVIVTASPSELDASDRIVLPGVGAFGDAMAAINRRELRTHLDRQALTLKKPILGICLGMQLMARSSREHGEHSGLGWVDADVRRLTVERPLKVPHVGWNEIQFDAADWLFRGIRSTEANFYFTHSFQVVCHRHTDVIASAWYGQAITSAIRSGNIIGVQFHPEKSQDNGLTMLRNWVDWVPCC
jgi:glutamine amidotransferase